MRPTMIELFLKVNENFHGSTKGKQKYICQVNSVKAETLYKHDNKNYFQLMGKVFSCLRQKMLSMGPFQLLSISHKSVLNRKKKL